MQGTFLKDPEAYAYFSLTRQACHLCGIPLRFSQRQWGRALTNHHIIKPGRSDDICNLLRLCQRCHDSAEGRDVVYSGVRYPKISIGVCLFLKKISEPGNYDQKRLEILFGKNLPQMEKIPSIYSQEWRRWQGNSTRFSVFQGAGSVFKPHNP